MNKIICEICGTVYPDTNELCPICGYPRESSKTLIDDDTVTAAPAADGTAARVKGGRYSNRNVKKRHKAVAAGESNQEPARTRKPEKATRGQIITVILLCIAIVLVSFYIGWRFFKGRNAYDNPSIPTEPSIPSTAGITEPVNVPCENLTVSDSTLTFTQVGESWWLMVMAEPANTTDELVILSSDESVVSVNNEGLVTAVGPGTATITVTCGEFSRVCVATCLFTGEETEPSETTRPTEPTEPEETTKPTKPAETGLVLSHKDVTLFKEGETFRISVKYNGETVSPAAVSFSSKDDTVATVEANGEVTAVGPGTTTITVNYNGETAKCIIRCNIETEETEETDPTEETEPTEDSEPTEDTEPTEEEAPGWQISNSDVTLRVGETFRLRLTNAAGETADVAWSVSKDGIVSVEGNTVTGLADGRVTLSATIDGQTYSCIVRVKG